MPVADMLRYVELARLGEETSDARRELLVAHREEVRQKLADLHATLAVLDHKIDLYSRSTEARSTETRTTEARTSETRSTETRSTETRPGDAQRIGTAPAAPAGPHEQRKTA